MSAPPLRPAGGLLREPLLWFVVVGLGIFGLDRLWPGATEAPRTVVSDATLTGLVAGFTESQGRAPTRVEIDALVETHADERRALREARELGLGRADPVVRRRLLQKLAFLDAGTIDDPGDAVLGAYLAENAGRYGRPERTDGVAIRLPPGGDPAAALATLSGGAPPGSLGVSAPHPPAWTGLSGARVGERTDPAVARALPDLALGAWAVVPAGAATWLVRLDVRHPAGTPPLADARERVLADWQAEERERRLGAARDARRARWPTERP